MMNRIIKSCLASLLLLLSVRASDPPISNAQDLPVEQKFKNIQVLKGLPESQLFAVMNFVRGSLGVSCAYCHVHTGDDKWEWDKDDKPTKRTARKMMQMVFDINRNHFNNTHRVSCSTCHRGDTSPIASLPLPQVPPAGGAAEVKPAVSLPSADEVLRKYAAALGGPTPVSQISTRVLKGEQLAWDGSSTPIEINQKLPNKLLITFKTPETTITRGFNGSSGWMKGPRGLRELAGAELARLQRDADYLRVLKPQELSNQFVVTGIEKIGDREAYVLQAPLAANKIEKFYFDTRTGLLLRDLLLTDTVIFWIPEQLDFDDYRSVSGVQIPFVVRQSYADPWVGWTRKFTDVKINEPVDDKSFNKPPEP